jgi:hypothetical protein
MLYKDPGQSYCKTSQRSPVSSDGESNQQQVSPLPVIAQELLGVCVTEGQFLFSC